MGFRTIIKQSSYVFASLRDLLAKATPERSGDRLARVAASNGEERIAAQMALADVPLRHFLAEHVIPAEDDEVTRMILESHDPVAFARIASLTVGEFRNWLLLDETTGEVLKALAPGVLPEMAAAVSKIMRNQDLIKVAAKIRNVTAFRNTIGLAGRMSVRLQPNDPVDDPKGIAAEIMDGLFYGCGDAVIGINPATDNSKSVSDLLFLLDGIIQRWSIPTQGCVLTHITTTIQAINSGVPVDLVFQSIGGTQRLNESFGINASILKEGLDAGTSLRRGTVGDHVMYFETGQGSALSANAHHGCDQQTLEARAYGLARLYHPLLVNTVVGFIGPEYLYDGKQIIRAALEDHFCGKLLGLPMGVDICYTNHAEADQNDMDNLLTLLAVAGCNFIMGVPGADDIMLNYQSTSFHDALYARSVMGLRPAPEFEAWLQGMGLFDERMMPRVLPATNPLLLAATDEARGTGPVKTPPNARSEPSIVVSNPWDSLRRFTAARIALGRCGSSLPTQEWLKFELAHAQARDAVHATLNAPAIAASLTRLTGRETVSVDSLATTRAEYIMRPDLGRQLSVASRAILATMRGAHDISLIVSDGLSATAIERNIIPFAQALLPRLNEAQLSLAPICIVRQGRVAIGDEVAAILGSQLSVVCIGERPGLSSPDSMGIYLTFAPSPGTTDERRNCISNVRFDGLSHETAAARLLHLARQALRLRISGVALKDDQGAGTEIADSDRES